MDDAISVQDICSGYLTLVTIALSQRMLFLPFACCSVRARIFWDTLHVGMGMAGTTASNFDVVHSWRI